MFWNEISLAKKSFLISLSPKRIHISASTQAPRLKAIYTTHQDNCQIMSRKKTSKIPVRAIVFYALTLLASISPSFSYSKNFYIDPVKGSNSNSGSSFSPWKSLQYVLDNNFIESQCWDSLPYSSDSQLIPKNAEALIRSGDTIYLRDGFYGQLAINGFYNTIPITIRAENNHTPIFSNIVITSSSAWVLKGLKVIPTKTKQQSRLFLVNIAAHPQYGPTSDITIDSCHILSTEDNVREWSKKDWKQRAYNGIQATGTQITLFSNLIENIATGISMGATHSVIMKNQITNFSGDGIRGLGDYCLYQKNIIKNCYHVDENHDDGFQSWATGENGKPGYGTIRGVILKENIIINWEGEKHPLTGVLQGIGCFDGMYQDWLVENNIIRVDSWHAISFYGANNIKIRHNQVFPSSMGEITPRILIGNHKNGTISKNCIIEDNITPQLIVKGRNHSIQNNNAENVYIEH